MTSASTDRVSGLTTSVAIKAPCRVATTANITLSGLQTIDGSVLVADDRVLVKDKTTQSENGIYYASTSTWQRCPDFDGPRDAVKGTMVLVVEGTVNAGSLWELTSTANPIVFGTSSITFAQNPIVSVRMTSTTSNAIATGSKSFTTQAGLPLGVGQFVLIADTANAANYMHGQVTSYSGTALVVNVLDIGGSGTKTSWNIFISSPQGTPSFGAGDMEVSTYDPLNVFEQLVGETAAQTLENKTLNSPVINGLVTGTWWGEKPQYGQIYGLLPTSQTFSSSTVASMVITAGQATDSTNVASLTGGPFNWNIANGNAANGYQGGTTLPNSDTIHFFICYGNSGACSFAHNGTTPTPPSGYNTYYRRIFSLRTNGSGVLLGGVAIEESGGGIIFWYTTQILDINISNQGTSRIAYTLSVPTGIKVSPIYRMNGNSGTSIYLILMSGDETDVAPTQGGNPLFTGAPGADFLTASTNVAITPARDGLLTTNTSGQIGIRGSTASLSVIFVTRGFRDFRRT